MTVALGLVCTDGVVVASDSMSTSGLRATEGQKVYALADLPIVWTAAGAVYTIEECEVALHELGALAAKEKVVGDRFATPDLAGIRQNLSTALRDAMKKSYESALPNGANMIPPPGPSHMFRADVLVLGWSKKKATPYFLEVAGDGQLNWHTDRKFYAIGSGGDFATVAQALMAHHVENDLPVELGRMVAYRAIESTCAVSAMGVRTPVQLAVADAEGARVLSSDEVDETSTAVERWEQIEKDAVVSLRTGASEPVPEAEPIPELEQ